MKLPAQFGPVVRVLAGVALLAVAACSSGPEETGTSTTTEAVPSTTTGLTSTSADATTTTAAAGPLDPNGVPIADHPDACALLTADDVEAAFGGMAFDDVRPGTSSIGDVELPKPGSCMHSADGGRFSVTLRVGSVSRDVQQAERFFETGKTINVPNLVEVTGIGDAAYDPGRLTPAVVALKDRVTFTVEVLPADGDASGRARALAAIAAERI